MINEKYLIGFMILCLSVITFFNLIESDTHVVDTKKIKVFSVMGKPQERLKMAAEEKLMKEEAAYHSPFDKKVWNSLTSLVDFVNNETSPDCHHDTDLILCETYEMNCLNIINTTDLSFPIKFNNLEYRWINDEKEIKIINKIDLLTKFSTLTIKIPPPIKINQLQSSSLKINKCITRRKNCLIKNDDVKQNIKDIYNIHKNNEEISDSYLSALLPKNKKIENCILKDLKLIPLSTKERCYTYQYLCNNSTNDFVKNQEEFESIQKIVNCDTMRINCIK